MKKLFPLLMALLFSLGYQGIAQNSQYMLTITPAGTSAADLTVTPGQVIQFSAKAYQFTSAGTKVEVPITSIVWAITPASFGTITAQGLFTAAGANSTTPRGMITATAVVGNMTLTANVIVMLQVQPQNGFTFSGNVSSAAGPIDGAQVSVLGTSAMNFLRSGKTDANGDFSVDVPAGAYIVRAQASGYLTEYFDNAASATLATVFTTDPTNPVTSNIDFVLSDGGHIRGTVLAAATSAPIAGATVLALPMNSTTPPNSTNGFHAVTDANGEYDIAGLPDGGFIVRANKSAFATQYFDGAADIANADVVTIASASTVTDVDFSLSTFGGSIAGTIRDDNGNPLADVVVTAWINGRPSTNAAGAAYGRTQSAADGSYLIAGLPPGDFIVRASTTGHIPEYYDDETDITLATAVTVTNQAVTGIDFALSVGGGIAGTVTNEDTSAPLVSASVIVRSLQQHFERACRTDAQGNYLIDGLPAGYYTVYASAYRFIGEYYNTSNTTVVGSVHVTGTAIVTGIDFALTPAPVAPRTYRGNVVARNSAAGLVGIVEAINPDNGLVLSTATNSQGTFEFEAWDNAILRARAVGYVGQYAGNTLDWKESRWEGVQSGMTFTLDPVAESGLAQFTGQINDASTGAGVANAWVYGMDAAGSLYFAVTGPSGAFGIANTANGSLDITVSEVGFERSSTATEIDDAHGSGTITAQRTGITSVKEPAATPATPTLRQNYPNPFNPATTISYSVPQQMPVRVTVFNLLGRNVAVLVDEVVTAGTHEVVWDASKLPSGIYLYRMDAGAKSQTLRMTLLK